MTPGRDEREVRAARNNARWCDAVCRAHGRPGIFLDALWIARDEVPRLYPNAVTLSRDSGAQLDAIRRLAADALPGSWSVKDSFAALDLAPLGFRPLFEARWLHRAAASTRVSANRGDTRWTTITDAADLAHWETAWGGESTDTNARVFLPVLLEDRSVAIVAGYRCRSVPGHAAGRLRTRIGSRGDAAARLRSPRAAQSLDPRKKNRAREGL